MEIKATSFTNIISKNCPLAFVCWTLRKNMFWGLLISTVRQSEESTIRKWNKLAWRKECPLRNFINWCNCSSSDLKFLKPSKARIRKKLIYIERSSKVCLLTTPFQHIWDDLCPSFISNLPEGNTRSNCYTKTTSCIKFSSL